MGNGGTPAPAEVRRVVWTDEAVANLDSIATYIQDFSPLAAQRLAVRLKNAADSLAAQSDRGRSVGNGYRELVVIYPYLIRYKVDADIVRIMRIRHGAQRP